MSYGHHISTSHEDVGLAEGDALVDDLGRSRNDEERLAILLQLGMLVCLAGVFDGEGMQIELRLHPGQQIIAGSNRPIQTTWPGRFDQFAGLLDRYARDAFAAGIDARGHDTGFASGACNLE